MNVSNGTTPALFNFRNMYKTLVQLIIEITLIWKTEYLFTHKNYLKTN